MMRTKKSCVGPEIRKGLAGAQFKGKVMRGERRSGIGNVGNLSQKGKGSKGVDTKSGRLRKARGKGGGKGGKGKKTPKGRDLLR